MKLSDSNLSGAKEGLYVCSSYNYRYLRFKLCRLVDSGAYVHENKLSFCFREEMLCWSKKSKGGN